MAHLYLFLAIGFVVVQWAAIAVIAKGRAAFTRREWALNILVSIVGFLLVWQWQWFLNHDHYM